MADQQASTIQELSDDELKGLMASMQSACDVVRVVDPSTFEAQSLGGADGEFAPAYRCYSALSHGRRCQNCISMRAVGEQRPVSKFEFVDGDAYFITARPISYNGAVHSLEMVQKVSDDVGLHDGIDQLQDHIQGQTDNEFNDSFTGAYTRKYFDEGLSSLRGRKLALVKVANLGRINEEAGHSTGDLVLKRVARELLKATRVVDSVIRYEGDTFAIQFEDMNTSAFHEHINEIAKAAGDVAVEDAPGVRPDLIVVAVDEDATFGELAQRACELVASAEQTGERVVMESADASHQAEEAVRVAAANETLRHAGDRLMADIDDLTGLLTSSAVRTQLQRVIGERHAREEGFCLVYLDIENFKQFNRTYGRSGGDVLLKFLADSITKQFPHSIAARVSGDIFIVITNERDLENRLEALRSLASSYQKRIAVELKAGVLELDEAVKGASAAIDLAKVACESLKGRYDLGVRFYDRALEQEISMNEYVVNNIETAIEKGHIKVFFQPIIRAMTGHVCDFEALCRWDDPQHGLLPPAAFISALEKFHLINKVDACVVRQACQHQASLLAAGRPVVPVSVNLSRLDFQLDDIFQVVEDAVAEAGIPRNLLNVEVTESALDEDAEYFRQQVDRFRAAGYEVWMDDFGSGYSSLNLLKDYRFDTLKIDMAFLAGFDDNPKSREIIVTIVDMAKKLGIRTLIEGVETKQQCRFLQRIGCEMLQGYYFGKPCPYSEESFADFIVEDAGERAYFDQLGSVNLLGAANADNAAGDGVTESESRSTPLALVEYRAGRYTVLSVNETYLELLESTHANSIDELQDAITNGSYRLEDNLVSQLDEARETGQEVTRVRQMAGGDYRVCVRHVAMGPGAHAFAVVPLLQ